MIVLLAVSPHRGGQPSAFEGEGCDLLDRQGDDHGIEIRGELPPGCLRGDSE